MATINLANMNFNIDRKRVEYYNYLGIYIQVHCDVNVNDVSVLQRDDHLNEHHFENK